MAEDALLDTDFREILGTDEATIDNRGRILLSKKKRDRLGDSFAMALGEVGCICAYPEARWRARMKEINGYPPNNQGKLKYTRLLLAGADDELSCDPQGRVVIPKKLQEMGKLKEKVLIVGCGDRIEIWDPEEYVKYEAAPDEYNKERRLQMVSAYNEMKG
ncbi:MAG: hypothetical protein P4L46_04385 [Fimbriimonas sp.]|nr:hypothetical protein [Fimbriimonas sp.]